MEHQRKAAVRGLFYPENCTKLEIYFQKFNAMIGSDIKSKSIFKVTPKAIIVPHAGYVYSGFTANAAYAIFSKNPAKRVIVIGPSHRHAFEGISGSYFESCETPCGDIPIDTAYLIDLAKKFKIGFEAKAHLKEHSTEVQMPFVQHYLPGAKVIELVYGKISPDYLTKIIVHLLKDKKSGVVISTDLSHFYTQEKAHSLDKICLEGITSLDSKKLDQGCEACGIIGLKSMIDAAKELGLKSQLLDYRTSADYSGDSSRVVGYASAIIY
ncbi:MAG: AmmeMemoRadiSam system protein B [Campylobacterota bacterium]|nr:AmmeMemoRadiSam system protein B [Campylobacterota bacterium]